MASERTELDLITQEWNNYGTTWTHNEEFDRDGYYVVKNLWNPEELYHPLPPETGSFKWWGKKLDQLQLILFRLLILHHLLLLEFFFEIHHIHLLPLPDLRL